MRFRFSALLLATTLALAPAARPQPQQDIEQACLKLAFQAMQHSKPLAEKVADTYASPSDRGSAAGKVCGVYARAVPILRNMGCYADVMEAVNGEFSSAKDILAAINHRFGSAHSCYATDGEWGSVQYENVDSFRGQ